MREEKQYYTYIMTNYQNTTLYVGMTNNLGKRVAEHKVHRNPKSFSAQYHLQKLVYYTGGDSPSGAIELEKRLKGGSRAKKVALINEMNPEWKDLSSEVGVDEYMDYALSCIQR